MLDDIGVSYADETPPAQSWWLYMVECAGGRIYTGIALDVDRRFAQHLAGRGARFTRMYPPIQVLARVRYPDHGSAARAEIAMKRLKSEEKRRWAIALHSSDSERLSKSHRGVDIIEVEDPCNTL
jgi:putative endonuclease